MVTGAEQIPDQVLTSQVQTQQYPNRFNINDPEISQTCLLIVQCAILCMREIFEWFLITKLVPHPILIFSARSTPYSSNNR